MYMITIQESFLDVISDVESGKITSESVWIARRNTRDEDHQEYYSVSLHLDNGKLAFTSVNEQPKKITISKVSLREFLITIKDDLGDHQHRLVFPSSKLDLHLQRSKVSTSAISPNGAHFIIGTENGQVLSYDPTTEQSVSEIACAHYTDVTKIAVFPSSEVMISVGADLCTKLWPVGESSDSPSRLYKEQKAEITDLVLIDRGRNFLTSSLDGSVLLWECSTAQVVSTFRRIDGLDDPATCMALAKGKIISEDITIGGEFLFGCRDKYVFVGYKSGVIQQYSVAGHFQTKIRFQRSSSVTSLSAHGQYLVAGYADGLVRIFDIDNVGKESVGNGEPFWDLQLSPHHAIEHMSVCKLRPDSKSLSFVVSNGPELLLRVTFDGASYEHHQLVGLDEMFRVVSIKHKDDSVLVTTQTAVVQY